MLPSRLFKSHLNESEEVLSLASTDTSSCLSTSTFLFSEPKRKTVPDAIKSLKQGVARRLIGGEKHFWQKRYYDFNIRNERQFVEKLRYIHRNPVKRGCVSILKIGGGAVFRSTQPDAKDACKSNRSGPQGNVIARNARYVRVRKCPTQTIKMV